MPTIKEQLDDESPTLKKKPLRCPPKIKISDTNKIRRGMMGGSFKIKL